MDQQETEMKQMLRNDIFSSPTGSAGGGGAGVGEVTHEKGLAEIQSELALPPANTGQLYIVSFSGSCYRKRNIIHAGLLPQLNNR